MIGGLQIYESEHCRQDIGLFCPFPKPSRNRSRRVRKKLMKRATYMVWEPVAYQAGDKLFCHPSIARTLTRSMGVVAPGGGTYLSDRGLQAAWGRFKP